MIAPLREPDPESTATVTRRELRRARRLAAAMLFTDTSSEPRPPAVPSWQAWLLTAWAVIVATGYIVYQALSLTPGP